jgi:excisionase family DNA binding protein
VGDRLDSWKEIARYLGREVRTVQRWAASRNLPVHRLPGGSRPRVFSLKSELDAWLRKSFEKPAEETQSLAVLPFLNLSDSEENQYIGDGLAEELINALVQLPGLRVIARTSSFVFSKRGHNVQDIGTQLGAQWVLEGSVRRDHRRVRIAAQLINTQNGYHVWSECYERRLIDIFDIEEELARSIAAALKVKLTTPALSERPTENLIAYDLWIKGRSISQEFTLDAFAQARQCFESSINCDPTFARPYFGMAELLFYGVQFGLDPKPEALLQVRAALTRSLELDEQSGEAHALLGICLGLLDYDWETAESEFQRALALSSGSASVLCQHAWYLLVPRMRLNEALNHAQQAVALDPLSPFARGRLGLICVAARKFPRAVEECRRAVKLAPTLWWLRWFYGTALLMQGKFTQGLKEFQTAYKKAPQPLVVGGMALVYGLLQRKKKAQELLSELQKISNSEYIPPIAYAMTYLGLGDDQVFEWLDKAVDARDPIVTHLPSMPMYDGIRDDPRFKALIVKMHLA